MHIGISVKFYFSLIVTKMWVGRQILVKISNVECENLSRRSHPVPCEQMDGRDEANEHT
jgi:hypothetical protein